jgi:hypothetical protein
MDDEGSIESLNRSHRPGYPSFRSGRLTIPYGIFILPGSCLTDLYGCPLFRAIVKIFIIATASCAFIIAWSPKQFLDNTYFLFIGIALLFAGSIDLMHTPA